MALDQVEVMRHFGFERFALCGHDCGERVGYRMALDNPGVVTKLAVLDIVPTSEALSRADMEFGLSYWHWFSLAQPFDLPERLLAVDPEKTLFRGGSEIFHPEALEEYVRCLRDPETIHATCEDYRAGATLDYEHDETDRETGKRIACSVLALRGRQGFLEEHYDVLEVWRGWAEEVRGGVLDRDYYLTEEAPKETYAELRVLRRLTLLLLGSLEERNQPIPLAGGLDAPTPPGRRGRTPRCARPSTASPRRATK